MSNEITVSKSAYAPAKVEREAFLKPSYRVKTEEHAFELHVAMPGVRRGDVNVSLEDGRLAILGTPHREVPESWRPIHEELSRATFRLELQLHRDIDEGAIGAKVEDGVLTLRLPLKEAVKPRVIPVH